MCYMNKALIDNNPSVESGYSFTRAEKPLAIFGQLQPRIICSATCFIGTSVEAEDTTNRV